MSAHTPHRFAPTHGGLSPQFRKQQCKRCTHALRIDSMHPNAPEKRAVREHALRNIAKYA
jgi:hypothetical protein